jgi:putative ABC transport system permease protein
VPRVALAILGVAVSAILVLVLLGAQRGLTEGVRSYVGQERVDLWVAPRGTDNLVRSSAMLPLPVVEILAREPGVREAAPVLRGFVSMTGPGLAEPITLLALGYRGPDGLGGPPTMASGRRPSGPREIVLDRAAAARLGAALGDEVHVNDRPFDVVGVSQGTNLFATQFVFLDGTEVERAAGMTGRVSFILLDLEDGADAAAVAASIEERYPAAQVWPRVTFAQSNIEELLAGFMPFIVLIAIVGAASATLLVALLVQGVVDERQRELAVLLALGAPIGALAIAVLAEAAVLLTLGVALGAAASVGLQRGLGVAVAGLTLQPAAIDVAIIAALFASAGLAAAFLPLLRLRRVDPAEAFRP